MPTADEILSRAESDGGLAVGSARNAFAITPDDANDLPQVTRAIMVSAAGNVKVNFDGQGWNLVLVGLMPGIIYPLAIRRVHNTNTTATGIIGLY